MNRMNIRWSDNDQYFGPFTYARDTHGYRPFGVQVSCCTNGRNQFRASAFGHTILFPLPPILKVCRVWERTYWYAYPREFGAFLIDGAVHLDYGAQTHDSTTDKSKVWFLPWCQTRHIRHSLYGLKGEIVADLPERAKGADWQCHRNVEQAILGVCPTARFEFTDFDGERLTATTRIEEREWAHGTGRFKWLSLFRRNIIRRSLDIDFSGETGKRKGSWKGGTTGTSIDMLPGELHEAAFRRYCAQNAMTFVGAPVRVDA